MDSQRVSIELSNSELESIKGICQKSGITATSFLKRAIVTEKFITETIAEKGSNSLVIDGKEVIFHSYSLV